MNSNQKEILERLLLMMKYDSSKTLNENIKIINEQYSPSKSGFIGDGVGWKPSTNKSVYNWPKGVDFPYVGQWVSNSDSRVTNTKTKNNFISSKDGKGGFFIPLPYEPNEGEDYTSNFNRWDGKVNKDVNGFYYIRMNEYKPNSESYLGYSKTNNYFDVFLRKNGQNLKYNPFDMKGSTVNPKTSFIKSSDVLLDKNGKLKDTKNLKNLLESIDKPETGIMNKWLKNPVGSEFGKLINAWTDLIMSKNLNELLELYNDVVKLGKGGNTPDLPNYGKGSTTFSSIILENEIYNRRAQNRKEGQPEPPRPEVIDGKTMYGIPQGYFVKTATDLYNQTNENTPNSENVNSFREWFNYFFPDKSKNPCGDGENLDKTGPVNKYVICAANFIPKKIERKGLLINPLGGTTRPPSIENTNKKTAFNIFKENLNSKLSTEPKSKSESNFTIGMSSGSVLSMAKEEGLIGMYYDGDVTDLMNSLVIKNPEKYKFTNSDYESVKKSQEIEMEKRKENQKMMNPEYRKEKEKEKEKEEKSQKDTFYKWVIKQQRVINIYNTEWLECTIGVKNESECGNVPYCGRGAKEFLEKIARGELKTSKGKTVGSAYRDSSGNVKYYVPDITSDGSSMKNQWDVPCTSDMWDEYGGYIQMGAAVAGIIASTVLTGPFGLAATTGLIAELSIDAIAGGYALYQSIKEKDNVGIAVNSVFLALPFLLDIPAADKFFKEVKYGKKAIADLSSKFDNFKLSNPTYTAQDLESWLGGLNGYELNTFNKVIKEIDKDSYFQKTMKDAINKNSDLFANATTSAKRFFIPKPGLQKMLVYTGPMAGYVFAVKNKTIKDSLVRLQANKRLTVQQVVAWDAALFGLTNDELLEISRRIQKDPTYLSEQSNTAEFKELEKTKKQLENTKITEDDGNKLLKKIDEDIEKLLKQQNLSGSEPIESTKTEEPSKSVETVPSQGVVKGRGDAK
jgi:hypothetical protein